MTMKDAKLNFVVETATELFIKNSISGVTVKDIAKECGLGEATVYRYFSGKNELIIACALKLQQKVEKIFASGEDDFSSGFEKISRFFHTYRDIFIKKPEMYRFLSEFDAHLIGENENLDEYADNMDRFKDFFMAAYLEGLKDNTVREIDDIETFYYSATHSVLSLCKKLSAQGSILRQDALTDKAKEISVLTDTLLYYLKK